MDDVLQLCIDVFPWISNQATRLGLETRDARFARLGGELFILSQQLQSPNIEAWMGPTLLKIAELINKACSLVRVKRTRKEQSLITLQKILRYKDSDAPDGIKVINDLRLSLPEFVQKNPEYNVLLSLIADCLRMTDSTDPLSDADTRPAYTDPKYPVHINNTLYTHLRIHSSCSCSAQHLDYARLRLDARHDKEKYADIPFELLFDASPVLAQNTGCSLHWKEAKIWVSRHIGSSKGKQVVFAAQPVELPSRGKNSLPPLEGSRKVQLGDFCRLIGSSDNTSIDFHIQNNAMRFTSSTPGTAWRDFLPQAGVPLSEWLEQTEYLSNRVKVTLAYTIARSVWKYYNSYWMKTPWTHDNIQMLKERINEYGRIGPHPYFTTKLDKRKGEMQDFYEADDVLHMYPNVLALAIVLIEIATKQPFKSDDPNSLWDVITINDKYEWAWTTANRSDLRNTVGAIYEKVVNSCLDGELFKDSLIDASNPDKNLEIRQSILYDKIVVPLRELYHAYIDDWDIQESSQVHSQSTSSLTSASKPDETKKSLSNCPSHTEFCVAIFCALPLEADAIGELLDEVWNEEDYYFKKSIGDDNTYTLGRISRHNVVLVHMPGMGKGAASQAASSLRSSYPGIKLALVIGICGGVPAHEGIEELILGDVVISDGIVQYDFGRQFPDGFSSKSGPEVRGRPLPRIRGMLAKFKVWRNRQRIEIKLAQYLDDLQNAVGAKRAGYPGIEKDELYHSTYRHKHHQHTSTCRSCSENDASRANGCKRLLNLDKFQPQEFILV
ncbi:hypothetical protein FE257_006159 [Aspergillus nanangensis]|uniref:Nucleoside phosphorylase domain-containing protein n=1 Tax=Aspergillus nanangensis TaxID=2582783 RepID=A0AAD4GUY4_ASPNN|nr:hypothetical protein FE257_006159 [Aspergillus nanangensis]